MRDVDDFTEFAATNEQRFFRHAYVLCGDREQARDLVQTTLLRLYRAWDRVRRADHVHAYAHRTLTNAYLESQRKSRREREFSVLREPPVTGDQTTLRMTVLDALAELPPRARAIVTLRYWEDFSVAQTAEIMACAPGTVKAQTSRALRLLRAHLGESFHQLIEESR